MRIAVLSDTHNHTEHVETALDGITRSGVRTILHCGDISSPGTIDLFAGFDAWFAVGNADQEYGALSGKVRELFGAGRMGGYLELEIDGFRIALCHGHTLTLDRLIRCDSYHYVFHGHTHIRRDETIGATRVVNPGAVGGTRRQSRSYCIVDSATGVEYVMLEG